MRCPECQEDASKVIDSRSAGDSIRRRRECLECGARFTTHERLEPRTLWVVKKDGRKEPFSRDKVLAGIALACRKRPVGAEQMDEAAGQVELRLEPRRETGVPSELVGQAVMDVLREIDDVAYVRFASVYRAFESVEQFVETVRPLRSPPHDPNRSHDPHTPHDPNRSDDPDESQGSATRLTLERETS